MNPRTNYIWAGVWTAISLSTLLANFWKIHAGRDVDWVTVGALFFTQVTLAGMNMQVADLKTRLNGRRSQGMRL